MGQTGGVSDDMCNSYVEARETIEQIVVEVLRLSEIALGNSLEFFFTVLTAMEVMSRTHIIQNIIHC